MKKKYDYTGILPRLINKRGGGKSLIISGLLLLMFTALQAQEIVKGVVRDDTGDPLPGVYIESESGQTTETDANGKYTITAKQGEELTFSYIGKEDLIKKVTGATLNITFDQIQKIQEVVVMGYVTRRKSLTTGSSVKISGEKIENIPMLTVDQALQGKVPGLQMSTTSGTPGSVQNIHIRGVGSITASNAPLFVVDGVPMINGDLSGGYFDENLGSSANSSLSTLTAFNNKDIASVVVLKDASATALYGARGANGVIVITTKRGKAGKTRFNFSSKIGFRNDAYNKRKPLTGAQRAELLVESVYNQWGKAFGWKDKNQARDFTIKNNLGHLADWDKKEHDWPGLLKNKDALFKDYSLSASGGGKKSSFYASLGYNKTQGTVIGADFDRITGTSSYKRVLSNKLDFETAMNVSFTRQGAINEQSSYFTNPFITRYLMTPFANPYNKDGTYNTDLPSSIYNTLYLMDHDINTNKLLRGISNSSLSYEIIDKLRFKTRIALDFNLASYKYYQNRKYGGGKATLGKTEQAENKNLNLVFQNSLNYAFQWDKNNFDVTALMEYQKNQYAKLYGYGEKFPTDGLTSLDVTAANWQAESSLSDWYQFSYLGLLSYNYDSKYVLDLTYRREGSSRFAKGKRFGDFMSAGAAYNMHREDFMQGSVFNNLKVKASWGITGNSGVDINSYQRLLSYSGYAGRAASYPSQLGYENLTWEKSENYDVGLDFGIFKNAVSGSFTYYGKRSYDLLQNVPLSLTTGLYSEATSDCKQARNIGEVINKGIEVELNFDVIKSKDFTWQLSGNIATVHNEVTKLALDLQGKEINPSAASSYKTTEVGGPIGGWYLRKWARVNPKSGKSTWYVNGVDGAMTSDYNKAKRAKQGSAIPKYSGGFSTHIQYKQLFLDTSFYFAGGHKIYETYSTFYLRTNLFTLHAYNGVKELMKRWQKPGDITDVPKVAFYSKDNFYKPSTRHLYDGDYMRLRNITIGYDLPHSLTDKLGIEGITFTIQGNNLATWLKDHDLKLDPEVINGYTALTTPPVKSIVFGVNLKF